MSRLVFDIEADGLLDELTKVHCIAIFDCDTGKADLYEPDSIQAALDRIAVADEVYGHNIIGFDLPALDKVYGFKVDINKITDTLLWSMRLFPDMLGKGKKKQIVDDDDDDIEEIILGHSLESWGRRLHVHKGDFKGPWTEYTKEMGEYCLQDVVVNEHIRRHFVRINKPAPIADYIEKRFAALVQRQEARGFAFDVDAAEALYSRLQSDLDALEATVVGQIPPRIEVLKTPAYYTVTWADGTTTDYETKGMADLDRKARKVKPSQCSIAPGPLREKSHSFNMGSRDQIRAYLYNKYGWLSPKLTEAGEKLLETQSAEKLAIDYGSLSEEILRACEFPEGQQFADFLLMGKVKSFLRGDGDSGWLRLVKDGRIHHRMLTIGCATGRCSHSKPNLGQVPSAAVGSDGHPLLGIAGRYGWECRSLFHADRVQVGVDMQAIEARNLAHYLQPYDGGAYVQQVLFGDIHRQNVDAIQKYASYTVSRRDSKTILYSWCYGAANLKIGTNTVLFSKEAAEEYGSLRDFYRRSPGNIKDKVWSKATKARRTATPEEAALMHVGAKVRNSLEKGIAGFECLQDALKIASKRGWLLMPDGRQLPIRSAHAALNTLLQGSAAVLMKKWVVLTEDYNLRDGVDWHSLAIVHDELQSDVHEDHVEQHSKNCIQAIKDAGVAFNWRCPLDGEAKVGNNWAECH